MSHQQFIYQSLAYIRADFIGVRPDLLGVIYFLFLLFFSLTIFLYFYLLGEKMRNRFFLFTQNWNEKHLINIALGYIVLCTGITLLGFWSLLTPFAIVSYLIGITIIILFPLKNFYHKFLEIIHSVSQLRNWFVNHRLLKIIISSFLLLSFLRITLPELEADAMAYHTVFPRLYLYYHTMLLSPAISIDPIAIPQLGEMPYLLSAFFHVAAGSKIIHFSFFILCIFVLLSLGGFKKDSRLRLYLVLIFVSSPIILQYASSTYSDFQHLFIFLVSIVILTKNQTINRRTLSLLGILFGGALATKFFALLYLPSVIIFLLYKLYLKKKLNIRNAIFYPLQFMVIAIFIPLPWYIRLYSLRGQVPESFGYSLITATPNFSLINLIKESLTIVNKVNPYILSEFSPLLFVGILGITIFLKTRRNDIFKNQLCIFIFIFLLIALFFPANMTSGRYFIPTFSLLSVFLAMGLVSLDRKFKYGKYVVVGITLLILSRFLINTLLLLPYGLGLSDKDKFTSRYLSTHTNAFYDFNHQFSKFISPNEKVITYNMDQFFYADFIPINIYYYVKPTSSSLIFNKTLGGSKLLIRGGSIKWMCAKMKINNCSVEKITLLASDSPSKQYLYLLNK